MSSYKLVENRIATVLAGFALLATILSNLQVRLGAMLSLSFGSYQSISSIQPLHGPSFSNGFLNLNTNPDHGHNPEAATRHSIESRATPASDKGLGATAEVRFCHAFRAGWTSSGAFVEQILIRVPSSC